MLWIHQALQVSLLQLLSLSSLLYTVQPTLGEGSSFDYMLQTFTVRALFFRPVPPDDVVLTFRVDAIAQESNETLSLELVPTSTTTLPTEGAIYYRRFLDITITDSDSKILLNN